MRSNWKPVAAIAALALLAAGCAGTNPLQGSPGSGGVAGFFPGLWHGLILPFSFVISLFNHGVRIYEVHNTGFTYDLGFLLGASSSLGGAGRGSARAKRDR